MEDIKMIFGLMQRDVIKEEYNKMTLIVIVEIYQKYDRIECDPMKSILSHSKSCVLLQAHISKKSLFENLALDQREVMLYADCFKP